MKIKPQSKTGNNKQKTEARRTSGSVQKKHSVELREEPKTQEA